MLGFPKGGVQIISPKVPKTRTLCYDESTCEVLMKQRVEGLGVDFLIWLVLVLLLVVGGLTSRPPRTTQPLPQTQHEH